MEQTFGSYVREKRMARGLSLRGLAAKLEVSPVYMSNMENDRRPARPADSQGSGRHRRGMAGVYRPHHPAAETGKLK